MKRFPLGDSHLHCAAVPDRLLHRIFRQRVLDVKHSSELSRHSLCRMIHDTLVKYDLEEEWDHVATDQLYEPDEWAAKVGKAVQAEETNARQICMAERSSLDTYASALVPDLGQVAPYLLRNRNREGAWIQCRLRSRTLPLMTTLAKRSPLASVSAQCELCEKVARPSGVPAALENVEHFLVGCQSPGSMSLRRELCERLRLVLNAATRDPRAKPPSGAKVVEEMISAVESAMSPSPESRLGVQPSSINGWCELILGRRSDPTTVPNGTPRSSLRSSGRRRTTFSCYGVRERHGSTVYRRSARVGTVSRT